MAGFALYLRVCCGLRSRIAGVCLKTPEIEFPTEDRKGKQRHGSSIQESAIRDQWSAQGREREGQVLGKTPSAHSRAQPPRHTQKPARVGDPGQRARMGSCIGTKTDTVSGILRPTPQREGTRWDPVFAPSSRTGTRACSG